MTGLWLAIATSWDWANGASWVFMGHGILGFRCMSEACDFFYGFITRKADPEQRQGIDRILSGTTEGVATTAEMESLDEFESFIADINANRVNKEEVNDGAS